MEHEEVSPYDFLDIKIGSETMRARPIEWNGEIVDNEGHLQDGSLAKPTKYETTCPNCGQMIIFNAGFVSIECPHCGHGEDIPVFDPNTDLNIDDIININEDDVISLQDDVFDSTEEDPIVPDDVFDSTEEDPIVPDDDFDDLVDNIIKRNDE